MRLLVSVADPSEARAALEGGADVIDAKQPRRGALGPVRPDVLAAIRQVVGAARPVSAALGDARDEAAIERAAGVAAGLRSEEHTSELQSPYDIVCRLLYAIKKTYKVTFLS